VTTGLNAHTIDLSNDGTRLTYSVFTHIANIWSLDIPRSGEVSLIQAVPLTHETQVVEVADVSGDGQWVVYDSNREGNQDVYKIPIGGGEPQRLTMDPSDDYAPAWSPDGSKIAFYSLRSGNRDLYLMNADGGELQQLTDDEAQDRNPRWSPDGNALAFASNRTGRNELYLMRRDPNNGTWGTEEQLTSEGGASPSWATGGDELVYRSNETQSIRVYSLSSGDSRVVVRDQDIGMTSAFAEWSSDGRTVYYTAYDEDETPSVWSIPAAGGSSRRVVTIDSPTQLFTRWNFTVHQTRFFFIIQRFESDVWSVELLTER
jgi:Tol biopolymer transport system component